uniref:Kielin cysteine rich BMP regulator n=1 Tax=Chelonoidis abingdonii TaxID=106734 RepID=A0A8C0G205_CHEAB
PPTPAPIHPDPPGLQSVLPSAPCPDTPPAVSGTPPPPSLASPLPQPNSSMCPQDEAVTCQREPCLQQCTHPVPPAAPSCCPDCDTCLFEGQELTSHQAVTPPSDPCQRCYCLHGNVLCTPVLCPEAACTSPVRRPGHCCPECPGEEPTASRGAPGVNFTASVVRLTSVHLTPRMGKLRPRAGKGPVLGCALLKSPATLPSAFTLSGGTPAPHWAGQTWCSCLRCASPATLSEPSTAPRPLSSGLGESPQCWLHPLPPDPDGSCSYQGQRYQASEHWQVDTCTTCTCVSGEVHCRSQRCPPTTCTPALTPGMCCPHCLPRPATCLAFGDPHYRTFDGRLLHFQGTCTYVLAQDCQGRDFSIHVTNDNRGRPGVAWTKEVTVQVGDAVVQLLQDWLVRVRWATLPGRTPAAPQQLAGLCALHCGVLPISPLPQVLWSGRSQLEVSVPGTYKGHTCGLCGDFNGHPQDDARLRSGQLARAEATFGNSWRPHLPCSLQRPPVPHQGIGVSTARGERPLLRAFEPCHPLVPPEPFFAACVYDLCACGAGADQCLCDVLEAYATLCRRAGLALRWPVGCPQDRGYVFDECGPPCPKTCYNKDAPLGAIESHCFTPCMPGCQCPAGRVEHEAHCILPEACPRVFYGSL